MSQGCMRAFPFTVKSNSPSRWVWRARPCGTGSDARVLGMWSFPYSGVKAPAYSSSWSIRRARGLSFGVGGIPTPEYGCSRTRRPRRVGPAGAARASFFFRKGMAALMECGIDARDAAVGLRVRAARSEIWHRRRQRKSFALGHAWIHLDSL
jgi:hypothetical protein